METKREDVCKRRVVVQRQRHARRERLDLEREERQIMVRHDLVTEHPEVPRIHAGVAGDRTRQRCAQVLRQRPREGDRDTHVPDQGAQMSAARTGRHWPGGLGTPPWPARKLGLRPTSPLPTDPAFKIGV